MLSEVFGCGNYAGKINVEYDDGDTYHVHPGQLQCVVKDEEKDAEAQLQRLIEEENRMKSRKAQL